MDIKTTDLLLSISRGEVIQLTNNKYARSYIELMEIAENDTSTTKSAKFIIMRNGMYEFSNIIDEHLQIYTLTK